MSSTSVGLACLGMRPAEVCGLRWSDVDLDEGTLAIRNTRAIVGGDVVEKPTKSQAGTRVLPLPAPVVAALRAFRKVQAAERLAAGEGYTSTGYVLVDELGCPQRTDWLRRRAYEQMAEHGIRRVRWYSTQIETPAAASAASRSFVIVPPDLGSRGSGLSGSGSPRDQSGAPAPPAAVFTACPPNWWRSAATAFIASETSWHEANRAKQRGLSGRSCVSVDRVFS